MNLAYRNGPMLSPTQNCHANFSSSGLTAVNEVGGF